MTVMTSRTDSHMLSHDTHAILLLCGRFGQATKDGTSPLTPAEYAELAQWLLHQGLRPADLLAPEPAAVLAEAPLDAGRLGTLLARGAALGLAVESWTNRGLWVISRSDQAYPRRLKSVLGRQAPPLLYGAGNVALLDRGGLAVVGSRDATEEALRFTRDVGQECARQGMQIVSGGARGVDSEAMLAALEGGGTVVGVLADSLSKQVVAGKYRAALLEDRLVLVSLYDPASGFSVGNAMGRNKHVYALADWGLVVSTALGEGGTWAGAIEALTMRKTPVFVRMASERPTAHEALLKRGAQPFPDPPWTHIAALLARAVESPAVTALDQEGPERGVTSEEAVASPAGTGTPEVSEHVALPTPATQTVGASVQQANDVTQATLGAPLYQVVLPVVLARLHEPRDVGALASELEVLPKQLQTWLERAVSDGMVTKIKKTKPAQYVARTSQPALFALPDAL